MCFSGWIDPKEYKNARVAVYNDAVAGLACGTDGVWCFFIGSLPVVEWLTLSAVIVSCAGTLQGIVIVSGTGMIALGQNSAASTSSSSSASDAKTDATDKYASLTAFKTTGGYGGFVDDGASWWSICLVFFR